MIRTIYILYLTYKNYRAREALHQHYNLKNLAAYGKANNDLYRAKYGYYEFL